MAHGAELGGHADTANTALIERAGTGDEYATAACITYHPTDQLLRWAYAGHPRALWPDDGEELTAPKQGAPLGVFADPRCVEASRRLKAGAGVLLITDGLTEDGTTASCSDSTA